MSLLANRKHEHYIKNKDKTSKRQHERYLKNKDAVRKYNKTYYLENKDRFAGQLKEYRRRNSGKKRAEWLLTRYGLTIEQHGVLFASQEQRCAICKTDMPTKLGWCVDHCHSTRQVRGILCQNCNSALGHMKDDPLRLRLAAEYLERDI